MDRLNVTLALMAAGIVGVISGITLAVLLHFVLTRY